MSFADSATTPSKAIREQIFRLVPQMVQTIGVGHNERLCASEGTQAWNRDVVRRQARSQIRAHSSHERICEMVRYNVWFVPLASME